MASSSLVVRPTNDSPPSDEHEDEDGMLFQRRVSDSELPDVGLGAAKSRRQGSSPSRASSRSINLNSDPASPYASILHPLQQYHEKSIENVIVCICITSLFVGIFSYLRLNIGWSIAAVSIATFSIRRRTDGIKDDFIAHMSRKRLEALIHPTSSSGTPPSESVEWMNELLATIWPILNPDLFTSLMDLLEDTMKRQSPSTLISGVRLSDLVLGSNSMRMLGFRVLGDDVEIGERSRDEEGDYISLEIEFSYRRLPNPTSSKKTSTQAHFLAYFAIGPTKTASIEVPVVVEIRGARGHLRLRIQLISDPPFVRHAFLTFPYLPEIEVVANPLKSAIDLMNVPILSQFIQKSIKDVLKTFTAPSWYSVDCSRILVGSDVEVSTRSTGVICVVVHSGVDLSGPDTGYISVGLARFGKPLYSTRHITHHASQPHFEEVFFVRVIPDDADEGDCVRLTVWDTDGGNTDDIVGRVDVPLDDLFNNPNSIRELREPLARVNRHSQPRGFITFSVGFFSLAARDLQKAFKNSSIPSSSSPAQGKGKDAKDAIVASHFRSHSTEVSSRAGLYSDRIKSALESLAPPEPDLPSGILSIQVHQLEHLEIPHVHGALGGGSKKEKERKREKLPPSAYCQLFVNDEKVLQTRVKKFSANPYVNASYEVFCRDWTTARVQLVVLDSRDKGHDVVIGMLYASVTHLLQSRTQKTMWHSLIGGVGYGRLRMSVLFKSVAIAIPRSLRSWNVGTLVVSQIKAHSIPATFSGTVTVSVGAASAKTGKAIAEVPPPTSVIKPKDKDDNALKSECNWTLEHVLQIPVLDRHQSPALFHLESDGHTFGEAVIWLSSIGDNDRGHVNIPIYAQQLERLRQNNYLGLPDIAKAGSAKEKKKAKRSSIGSHLSVHLPAAVGVLEVHFRFESGLSGLHQHLPKATRHDIEDALRAWHIRHEGPDRPFDHLQKAASPAQSRTPTASQPNSRRSSWGDMPDVLEMMHDEALADLSHSRTNSTDAVVNKAKLPKSIKWMKDGKKRLSKIAKFTRGDDKDSLEQAPPNDSHDEQ